MTDAARDEPEKDFIPYVPPSPDEKLPPYQKHSHTSREAAEAAQGQEPTWKAKVFHALQQGPKTDEEITDFWGMAPSTERPRRIDLVSEGKVRDSGKVRKTKAGRNAVVWEVV